MSNTELERLARIRMHITGETLERAMAVLEGHASPSESHTGLGTAADTGADAAGDHEAGEAAPSADAADSAEAVDGSEHTLRRDEQRTPPRRGHLRGL
ncbi:hypothetical protein [Streptomyces kronopolitis]|uniref:hypothetical protein n=1 Tax=Streptomyces kronopolitis TaxID=1612435 RepID=UPI00166C0011|nr:hypothetical protein [Streptomyces kronopolitis]